MTELICIVCPKGCHLKVDEENNYAVTGNTCEKGVDYGKKELINPTRVITSTVKLNAKFQVRLPVKTSKDIPKGRIKEAMALLNDITVDAPVKIGDVIVRDILGLGADFVATKSVLQ